MTGSSYAPRNFHAYFTPPKIIYLIDKKNEKKDFRKLIISNP
jgi:hypothetical protein